MSDFHARYRMIIDAYRQALLSTNPELCRTIDGKMAERGQGWVSATYDEPNLDRLMTAQEIADEFGYSAQNIRDWQRSHPQQIHKYKSGGQAFYHLREVLAYHARRQSR